MEVFDASLWSMVCRTAALTSILANKISSIVWRNCLVQNSVSDLVEPSKQDAVYLCLLHRGCGFCAVVDSLCWTAKICLQIVSFQYSEYTRFVVASYYLQLWLDESCPY